MGHGSQLPACNPDVTSGNRCKEAADCSIALLVTLSQTPLHRVAQLLCVTVQRSVRRDHPKRSARAEALSVRIQWSVATSSTVQQCTLIDPATESSSQWHNSCCASLCKAVCAKVTPSAVLQSSASQQKGLWVRGCRMRVSRAEQRCTPGQPAADPYAQ